MKPPKNHFVSCLSAEFPKWDGTKLGISEMDWGQIGNSPNGLGPNWEFPIWTGAKSGIPEMVHLEFSDSVLVFVRGAIWQQGEYYSYNPWLNTVNASDFT